MRALTNNRLGWQLPSPAGGHHSEADHQTRVQISEWAKAAGIPLIFIGYPFSREHFGVANRAAAEVAAATGAYYLPTDAAFSRVSGDGGMLLRGGHLAAPVYTEIARELAPLILRLSDPTADPPGLES